PDASVDRLIIVHCLEHAERAEPLLDEVWRILAPEGHALFVVPNRGGIWARVDSTPFGQGRPYTRGQLERLLRRSRLMPVNYTGALQMPPVERSWVMRSAPAFERLGARLMPGFAGVMMLETRKEVSRPARSGTPAEALSELVRLPGVRPAAAAGQSRAHGSGRRTARGTEGGGPIDAVRRAQTVEGHDRD
ncbi:MAG: methyltransferase domain-containing protein, partial [Pseudomonadota bacterium]